MLPMLGTMRAQELRRCCVRRYALDLPVRFDLVTVVAGEGGPRVEHFEDAFRPSLC